MRVLVFSGYFLPGYKGGGPIKTLKNLFDATPESEIQYRFVTSDRDSGDLRPYSSVKVGEWNEIEKIPVFYIQRGCIGLFQIFDLIKKGGYDCLYINSFFSFRFAIVPQLVATFYKRKVILAPRGELSQGALRMKQVKKKIFISIYKFFRLNVKSIFQASSIYEYNDIKKTLGNSVDVQIAENIATKEFAQGIHKRSSCSTRIVFISRISPKKNLLQAIEILEKVRASVEYDIYGPIEDHEYWDKCKDAMKRLAPNVSIRYKGTVSPEEVVSTLAQYDLFFFPTLSENYGHVIVEAFCAGLPVLISDTTPWRDLEEKGIGWDLPLNAPDKFAKVIDAFSDLTDDAHNSKRTKVLQWAKQKFSQPDTIDANIAMFKYANEKLGSNDVV